MKRLLVKMTPEILGQFCKTTNHKNISIDGVPEDSKFIAAHFKHEECCFHVCFEHESFEDIPEGVQMPFFNITVNVSTDKCNGKNCERKHKCKHYNKNESKTFCSWISDKEFEDHFENIS